MRLCNVVGCAVLGLAVAAVVESSCGAPASAQQAPQPLKGDADRAARARAHTLELSTNLANKELEGADLADPLLAIERARTMLYEGRCVESGMTLAQGGLDERDPAKGIASAARGCIQTMAGGVTREDEASGTWIRFQDDADVVLAPFIFDCVTKARALFEAELGVTMPTTVRIEIVRDQFGLSAMTGLPLEAARTTGTIGIAKWGRLIVISPRATPRGYGFLDTIAHELTHLALTRGSQDRAPLWLQEGVARGLESKWRAPQPFDDRPSADALAAWGYANKIGPDIDAIGPSIALLPSAQAAAVTYAKVESFMDFYAHAAGDGAMPRLLNAFKTADDPDKLDAIVEGVTGSRFMSWKDRWRNEVLASTKELPVELRPGASPPKEMKETRQRYRLGELLLDRGHAEAATKELARANELIPNDATVRALYARAKVDAGNADAAKEVVANVEDVASDDARWWSMRGFLGIGDVVQARFTAISQAPYTPSVACAEKKAPETPDDANERALCEAARAMPRSL